MRAILYTTLALFAFAANSLLGRMALGGTHIDPWSFTIIRLLSAAFCLGIIMAVALIIDRYRLQHNYFDHNNATPNHALLADKGSWLSTLALLIYALCFSIAYVALDTGTGALILFSAVQLTMISWGVYNKEHLSYLQWLAFGTALIGFVYLMLPSAAMPSLFAALLMMISGIAWGVYSIRGAACVSPLRATTYNFIKSLIAIPILLLFAISHINTISIKGIILACASGAIASGIGYSIWYMAMPRLKNTQAAIIQLCVPILAALMGVMVLDEQLTLPFILTSIVILTAILLFMLAKPRKMKSI